MAKLSKAELRQELLDHGFHYLSSEPGRADRFVQQAVDHLQLEYTWSWRRRAETPAASTVVGLGRIEEVLRASDGRALQPTTRKLLRERWGQITTAGVAEYYWREGEQIGTFPVESGFTVVHFTQLPWLANDGVTYKRAATLETDVPLAPEEFGELIVLGAVVRAYRDVQQTELGAAAQQDYDSELERLWSNDGRVQVDEHRRVKVTAEEWA